MMRSTNNKRLPHSQHIKLNSSDEELEDYPSPPPSSNPFPHPPRRIKTPSRQKGNWLYEIFYFIFVVMIGGIFISVKNTTQAFLSHQLVKPVVQPVTIITNVTASTIIAATSAVNAAALIPNLLTGFKIKEATLKWLIAFWKNTPGIAISASLLGAASEIVNARLNYRFFNQALIGIINSFKKIRISRWYWIPAITYLLLSGLSSISAGAISFEGFEFLAPISLFIPFAIGFANFLSSFTSRIVGINKTVESFLEHKTIFLQQAIINKIKYMNKDSLLTIDNLLFDKAKKLLSAHANQGKPNTLTEKDLSKLFFLLAKNVAEVTEHRAFHQKNYANDIIEKAISGMNLLIFFTFFTAAFIVFAQKTKNGLDELADIANIEMPDMTYQLLSYTFSLLGGLPSAALYGKFGAQFIYTYKDALWFAVKHRKYFPLFVIDTLCVAASAASMFYVGKNIEDGDIIAFTKKVFPMLDHIPLGLLLGAGAAGGAGAVNAGIFDVYRNRPNNHPSNRTKITEELLHYYQNPATQMVKPGQAKKFLAKRVEHAKFFLIPGTPPVAVKDEEMGQEMHHVNNRRHVSHHRRHSCSY